MGISEQSQWRWTAVILVLAISTLSKASGATHRSPTPPSAAVETQEFIFENPPFDSCHASTIEQTRSGLISAWFAGSEEGALDVGIWLSSHDGLKWSAPKEVASGYNEAKRIRYPCWNPVLFRPRVGPLYLFYKVGPSPSSWWGVVMSSGDDGATWSDPRRLPEGILGPIKNKPVELSDGTLLCGSSTENAGWRVHMERTRNPFGEWTRTPALNSAMEFGAIQPTVLVHGPAAIQILCRAKQGAITESWSSDGGLMWSRMMAINLPNPNSGLDAVQLRDGRSLLVYNHTTRGRGVLNVALSEKGKDWEAALVLEDQPGDEYSYPAVIQTSDAKVHITYTWKRKRIKHVVLDPFKLKSVPMPEGNWP